MAEFSTPGTCQMLLEKGRLTSVKFAVAVLLAAWMSSKWENWEPFKPPPPLPDDNLGQSDGTTQVLQRGKKGRTGDKKRHL